MRGKRRETVRREIAASGLAGARREGRSEVSAKRARLRLRLPSRRTTRARYGTPRSGRSFLSRPSLDLASRLGFISSSASVFRARDNCFSLAPRFSFRGAKPHCLNSRWTRWTEWLSTKDEGSSIRRIYASRYCFIFLFPPLAMTRERDGLPSVSLEALDN